MATSPPNASLGLLTYSQDPSLSGFAQAIYSQPPLLRHRESRCPTRLPSLATVCYLVLTLSYCGSLYASISDGWIPGQEYISIRTN